MEPRPIAGLLWGGLLGLSLSLAAIRWLAPRGWMDVPDARKRHQEATPLTGGLALWAVLVLGHLTGWLRLPFHGVDWTAIHAMALMGAVDDRFGLRARYKALIGLLVALVLGWHAAQGLLPQGGLVHVARLDLPNRLAFTVPLAVLWFWGIPQAFNLIDGMNGLALGLAALLLVVLGFGAGSGASVLLGAVVAALVLNYPRARHFLGDAGAFLLGTLLAILALKRGLPAHPNLALWVFAYPIVDVTLVVAIRLIQRRSLAEADHNHLHDWMSEHLERFGVPRPRLAATPLLLLLAAGPMLHVLPWAYAHPVGLAGLALLLVVAAAQCRIVLLRRERVEAALPEPRVVSAPRVSGAHRIATQPPVRSERRG